ncbi:hypothetical protein RND71_010525 [Anisodus tanguticus]|uniref:Uncharacterized protein n=1 Tax=Anisodus tanguticus TaxID=243964 RepID=A0AAE1VSR4_9SOLA|nr:hypothetical protein RND71_010525 [Anisodus tanguticus]
MPVDFYFDPLDEYHLHISSSLGFIAAAAESHLSTLSQNDLWNPEISALVAAKIKEFHMIDKSGSKSAVLWMELNAPKSKLIKSRTKKLTSSQ